MTEADTCRKYVVPKLKSAGWEDEYIEEQLVLTPGRIVPVGNQHTRKIGLRPGYVLFIRRNIPIAVWKPSQNSSIPLRACSKPCNMQK